MPIAFTGSFTTGSVNSTAGTSFSFTSTNNAPTGSVAFVGVAVNNLNCTNAAWSSRSSMITARRDLAGAGTQNAALGFGGSASPPVVVACTEAYNGTSWSIGGALINSRRGLAGAGASNTAALAFGAPTCTEAYNGTSWSSGGAMINGRSFLAGTGTQNAALGIGAGFTEAYNGTIWSTGGAMITSRSCLGGAGTQNSALAFGGGTNITACNTTEAYNGTSWSSGGALINPRVGNVGSGASNSAVITYGGARPGVGQITISENYNGTSWSNGSALSLGRYFLGNAGNTNTSALAFGGRDSFGGVQTACTEAYNVNTFYTSSLVTRITDNNYNTNTFSYAFQGTGSGFNNTVRTVISDGSGSFYVGGDFTTYNGASAPYLVRLNSSGIVSQSFGLDGPVYKVLIQNGVTGTTSVASWSTGGAMISGRATPIGAGIQNTALAAGGYTPGTGLTCAEKYDGSTWATTTALIDRKQQGAGAGTQNEALVFGGQNQFGNTNNTQEFNGTTWSTGGNMITARNFLAGAGTQNSALAFSTSTEAYNGTSWSSCTGLISGRSQLAGAGTQNSTLAFGGQGGLSCTEAYNGTAWATGGALINGRERSGGTGANSSIAIAFAGGPSTPSRTRCTEAYNGTSWSAQSAMICARLMPGSAGTRSCALAFGGYGGGFLNVTEEFTISQTTTLNTSPKLLAVGEFTCYLGVPVNRAIRFNIDNASPDFSFATSSSFNNTVCTVLEQSSSAYLGSIVPNWSAGGAMITARDYLAGAGTQNAALGFGGYASPVVLACTEEYNGTSWSSGGAMITARRSLAGAGTQNEALAFGNPACTEEYNGTTWSAGGAMIIARSDLAGAGTQNAALGFGGGAPLGTCTEAYDGTTWSAGGAMITARAVLGGAGTQNAALAFGGSIPTCTEEYNGTTWSAGGALISGRNTLAGAGTQNSALAFGGLIALSDTEAYNGSAWSTRASMIRGRSALGGAGASNTEALAYGGSDPAPPVTCTEAFSTFVLHRSKLILGGAFTQYSGSTSSGSVRVNNDGSLDSTFNIGSGFSPVDVRCIVRYIGLGTWSSGGALITARCGLSGAGVLSAGLAFGGSSTSCTEEYNGTSWSAGGALITARNNLNGAGTQNAAVALSGGSPPVDRCHETYNGTTWTNQTAITLNWSKGAAVGAPSAVTLVGANNGSFPFAGAGVGQATYLWNGSSWSFGSPLITGRFSHTAAGTQNSTLAVGGSPAISCTESFNGSTWSTGAALITARQLLAGAGTSNTSVSVFGGDTPTIVGSTESYNGITWSVRATLITPRNNSGCAGTQNSPLTFGGATPTAVACTEAFDLGGSLAFVGNFTSYSGSTTCRIVSVNENTGILETGFKTGTGFNNAVNSIIVRPNGALLTTGEFTAYSGSNINFLSGVNIDGTIDTAFSSSIGSGLNNTGSALYIYPTGSVASWSTVGAMITARTQLAGAGRQNLAVAFGGATPTIVACTEIFNGGSWIAGPALILNRCSLAGIGTDFAALAFGGANNSIQNVTEAYNGTSCVWVLGSNLITRRQDLAGAGTQNAALGFGGATPTIVACTEIYNGISWRAGSAMITARCTLAGAGIQNAALAFGGRAASPIGFNACTEAYNGTSWSTGGAMINARAALAGAGLQNAALAFGGTPVGACTEAYNGTSWSTGCAIITSRSGLSSGGTQNAAIGFGGATPTIVTCTETYNTPQILVGGSFTTFSGSNYSGSVRLFLNGTLDSTYTVGTGYSGSTQVLDYLAVSSSQAGSRIFSVGGFTTYGGATQNCVQTTTINPQSNQNRIILLNPDGTMAGTYLSGTGSVYTKIAEAVQVSGSNEGVAVALFKTEVTGALGSIPPGTIGTITLVGSIVNKAAGGIIVGNFPTTNLTSSFALTGSESTTLNPPSMALPSGSFGENLILRVVAHEGPVSDTFRPTGGFTSFINNYDTWGTRTAMIVARQQLAGAGTQNAGIGFGGFTTVAVSCTETYNGSTWTAGGAMITARYGLAGAGTRTATLGFGGITTVCVACTEAYNGTTWASGGAMIIARRNLAGAGTNTAALAFGGVATAPTSLACTERYNGTSWSTTGAMINARSCLGGAGIQNAALAFGGFTTVNATCTEAFNGTSWSSQGAMITSRSLLTGTGTQNEALAFGGSATAPTSISCTELYNGVLWSVGASMIVARQLSGGSGVQSAGLAFGGTITSPTAVSCTEGYIRNNRIGTYLNCTNAFSELSLAGEFIIANNNIQSSPLYLSGSNSNILFGCTFSEIIFGGKTFYISVD